MTTELILQIEGEQAEMIASALQKHLAEHKLDIAIKPRPIESPPSSNKASVGEVLSIASFIIAIPSFYLTMDTLLKRLDSKSKLEKLAKQADELTGNRQEKVWIIVDGKPYELMTKNVPVIHEAMAKQASLQKKP